MNRYYPCRDDQNLRHESNSNNVPRHSKPRGQNVRHNTNSTSHVSVEGSSDPSEHPSYQDNDTASSKRFDGGHRGAFRTQNKQDYDNSKASNDEQYNSGNNSSSQSRNRYYHGTRKNSNRAKEIPPRFSQAAAHTSGVPLGSVINGCYVRNNSSSKLNVDAPPFIPKCNEGSNLADTHSSNGTRQKYVARNSNDGHYNQRSFHNQHHHRSYHHNQSFQNAHPQARNFKYTNKVNLYDDSSSTALSQEHFDGEIPEEKADVGGEIFINSNMQINKSNTSKAFYSSKQGEPTMQSGNKSGVPKVFYSPKKEEPSTQRDRLVLQLEKGECECLVCCEHIRTRDYIWSCGNCYHVFHLKCIKKWARSSTAAVNDSGWRCPACQNVCDKVPYDYYCFCGKCKDPEVNFHFTPHTCGDVCGKQREDELCIHRCNILCHPGPCPPCSVTVNRACECGKTSKVVSCAKHEPITCTGVCEKILNCGIHYCQMKCHAGSCDPCAQILKQYCYCMRDEREVLCSPATSKELKYSCGMTCGQRLNCGNHNCAAICHRGPCESCQLLPNAVTSCPCGKKLLEELYESKKAVVRLSCRDPIPVCGMICENILMCGPKGNPHRCSLDCHIGECPPCGLTTMVKCRCGSVSKEILCKDMVNGQFVFHCEKRCNKRKDCGRHKCLNNCCINLVHKCDLVCNKKLSCGLHHCQETCHAGNCPMCWNVSFDELKCHCGFSILYPPIHCGTTPPECSKPCIRSHPCDHQVQHSCHNDERCPPCTILTTKWCFGQHEKRPSVQCFLDGISCGKPCNKDIPCGRHQCIETCHSGSCFKPDAKCTQLCSVLRPCGHACNAPCHEGDCPDTICKAKVQIACPCGNRTENTTCSEDTGAFHLMSVRMLASKIQDIKAGESVNINDMFNKKGKVSRLLCNEECAVLERNKKLAVALQIRNPDLSCKPGPPTYSEFLKDETRKNKKFVSEVYEKCSELVQLAKQSKQKSRSHAFPPMKRDQRRVVHELAEFFGCETQSYDEEPVKNVVITAYRERCWLPFVSVITVVERDMGLRRGPLPVTHLTTKTQPPPPDANTEKKAKVIDYFDYTGS